MQRIRDLTRGVDLAANAGVADNAWTRFRGLMLRAPLSDGEALVIKPCGSIHMMFMRFAIDAVFFDKDGRVTKVARGVRPWIGLAFGGKGAKSVIELPKGAAAEVAVGDQLEFESL